MDLRLLVQKRLRELGYLTETQILDLDNSMYQKAKKKLPNEDDKLINNLYKQICKNIIENMDPERYVKNHGLKDKIISGEIKVINLINLSPRELFPEIWKDYEYKEKAEITQITQGNLRAKSTLYKCSRCGHGITLVEQDQTRSCDEGSTLTIECESCGNCWNIRN